MYQSTMVSQQDAPAPVNSETDGYKFIRGADGSITVKGATEGPRVPRAGDFDANLAEIVDEAELTTIASRLIEYFDVDKESRKDWEKTEEKALEMMGVKQVPEDDNFLPGIHKVVHPLLAEAAVNFQARSIVEIFPDTGPVKTRIFGPVTKERQQQAQRIEDFGNYYLTEVDDGYFNDTDQMLMYLPLAGSAFRKCGQDWSTGMPELRYVKATNFVAPYNGSTLRKMSRYCHWYTMLGQDIDQAIDLGFWRDASLTQAPASGVENSKTEDTSDGRTIATHEDDDVHTIYEYHVNLGFEFDGQPKGERNRVLPYIVIVDRDSEKVLMIRRNWKENDKKRRKRVWFAHHKFLQGLGFYGWGYTHVIGSLLRAVSGSVNALLDSAYAANFQGGFKTKEGRSVGDVTLEHGVWKDVEATFEQLQHSFYTPPFREPSAALAALLEQLVNSGQRFMSTVDVAVGDAENDAPVGTTIALIDEAQKVMSAVHKRIHKSMGDELKMWAEMVADVMPNHYEYDTNDETRHLLKSDFDGRVDVVPVTNPNISSNTQRLATAQLVMDTITNNPDLFSKAKRIAAIRRMWMAAKVPEVDEVAPDDDDKPMYIDPISENGLMMVGKAVRAFETQDHASHNTVHQHGRQTLIASPAFAMMQPERQQMAISQYDAHMAEHEALGYRRMIMGATGVPMPPLGPDGLPISLEPETEAMITAEIVKRLPPPPPPPQDQGGEADAMIAKTQAAIAAKDMDAKAKVARDDEAFVSSEKRKEEEHQESLRRQRQTSALEESRKDQTTAADLLRKKADAAVSQGIKKTEGAVRTAITAQQAKAKAAAAKKAPKKKQAGK